MRPTGALTAPLLLCALAAGCGGASPKSATAGPIVPITERDFQISAPTHLASGPVTFRVKNEGPEEEELIIAPARAGGLPMRRDGLTVDEESIEQSEPGSLEPGKAGSVRYLHVNLSPGRYILFCNIEGHYLAGMHEEVTVG